MSESAISSKSLINSEAAAINNFPIKLGDDGIPILEEVVEDAVFDDLAADIEARLVLDLEPHLQDLVRRAFTDTIRLVALDLKHAFERELNKQLDLRLRSLVSECVQRACQKVRI